MDIRKEEVVEKIKRKRIDYYDIPLELLEDKDVIEAERMVGLRKASRRGYDIVRDIFFVEETICDLDGNDVEEVEELTFETFDKYYAFLNGDIYSEACYFQYDFSKEEIEKYKIEKEKINSTSLIDYTINETSIEKIINNKRITCLENKETKEKHMKWIEKMAKCKDLKETKHVLNDYKKSKINSGNFIDLLIYYFIMLNKNSYNILVESINKSDFGTKEIISKEKMCLYFAPDDVVKAIDYKDSMWSKSTKSKYIRQLKDFANAIKNNLYPKTTDKYYDEKIDCFVIKESYKVPNSFFPVTIKRFFWNFEEFKKYLKNDLSNCDLSNANIKQIDLKGCIIKNTIPPIQNVELRYSIDKSYIKDNSNGNRFVVKQVWKDKYGNEIYKQVDEFKYFFDFAYFLRNDLSNANLVDCDGIYNLKNMKNINEFNLSNIQLISKDMDALGLQYKEIKIDKGRIKSFKRTLTNEDDTKPILYQERKIVSDFDLEIGYKRVSYVSDIHLMHRLEKCKSAYDVKHTINEIVYEILNNSARLLLIGGDVSSNYSYYKAFISEIARCIDERKKVIFILGNHELWDFESESLENIVEKYRKLVTSHGMFFVHNDLLYIEDEKIKFIKEKEIKELSEGKIKEKVKRSSLIITGGIGFSGRNNEFNAQNGIYRKTINRTQEKEESRKFEEIYNKLAQCLKSKNVIIFTHMPKSDWSSNNEYVSNWVYVSGHTHRNYFYDDGDNRIYADAQLGYQYNTAFSKSLLIEYGYDVFFNYTDGIYEITDEEYKDFYRGKNIRMDYHREGKIYMLKKDGYYCFMRESNGGLCILNGGALTSLPERDINYYYDKMSDQIKMIKTPLDKYTKYQEEIAIFFKKIGGTGTIHGCIIDIDYCNHVYVDPVNSTLTGYFAIDTIHKYAYPDIESLLKMQCPLLYSNYEKLLKSKSEDALALVEKSKKTESKPMLYTGLEIYYGSNIIKKMQRLNTGILTVWYENTKKLNEQNRKLLN